MGKKRLIKHTLTESSSSREVGTATSSDDTEYRKLKMARSGTISPTSSNRDKISANVHSVEYEHSTKDSKLHKTKRKKKHKESTRDEPPSQHSCLTISGTNGDIAKHQSIANLSFISSERKKKQKKKMFRDKKDTFEDGDSKISMSAMPVAKVAICSDSSNATIEYPYDVQADDHCESPVEAYCDITPFLRAFAHAIGKSPQELAIYDPYFCEGSVVQRLKSLGFHSVYNKKEDFYARIENNSVPAYDVLLTNPPYSGEHMERLLRFCVSSNKPWLLLIPNYVYTKDYYSQIVYGHNSTFGRGKGGRTQHLWTAGAAAGAAAHHHNNNSGPFYVTPVRRYQYTTPKGRRQAKSAKYTSPFPTFWFSHFGRYFS